MGYLGDQRVCDRCFEVKPPKRTKKRSRTSTASEPVLQAEMLLTDSLGRPVRRFYFCLTVNSFRWYKHQHEEESAFHVMTRDILAVRHPSEKEFIVHTYPLQSNGNRNRLLIRVHCDSKEQRDEWTQEILTRMRHKQQTSWEGITRKLLILVNPFSGQKKGHQVWKEAEKILRLAEIELSVRYTEYEGHGAELASTIQIGAFHGIVCVSGDGLVHEVFNGLLHRPDWEEAIKIPVGTIPAGSGCALAAELSAMDVTSAAFNIARGDTRPLDILQVQQEGEKDTFSFLSVNWGMISDVDFESERYRFMGGARFTVGAVVRIANLRVYKGILEYVPAERRPFKNCTRAIDCSECFAQRQEEQQHQRGEEEIAVEAEPEVWERMEGEFVTIIGCNFSKLSYDLHSAPYAHLSDGSIDMLVLEKCPRGDLANLFLQMETGEFVNHSSFNTGSFVHYLKVKKFKLTSQSSTTVFGFDGERAKSQKPVTVTNRHGLATLLG